MKKIILLLILFILISITYSKPYGSSRSIYSDSELIKIKNTIRNEKFTGFAPYLFYNKTLNNLTLTANVNKTVYNFLKDAYNNLTLAKCNKIANYLSDEYPNLDCTNPNHQAKIMDALSYYANNIVPFIKNGINEGTIDLEGNQILINLSKIGDRFSIGNNTYDAQIIQKIEAEGGHILESDTEVILINDKEWYHNESGELRYILNGSKILDGYVMRDKLPSYTKRFGFYTKNYYNNSLYMQPYFINDSIVPSKSSSNIYYDESKLNVTIKEGYVSFDHSELWDPTLNTFIDTAIGIWDFNQPASTTDFINYLDRDNDLDDAGSGTPNNSISDIHGGSALVVGTNNLARTESATFLSSADDYENFSTIAIIKPVNYTSNSRYVLMDGLVQRRISIDSDGYYSGYWAGASSGTYNANNNIVSVLNGWQMVATGCYNTSVVTNCTIFGNDSSVDSVNLGAQKANQGNGRMWAGGATEGTGIDMYYDHILVIEGQYIDLTTFEDIRDNIFTGDITDYQGLLGYPDGYVASLLHQDILIDDDTHGATSATTGYIDDMEAGSYGDFAMMFDLTSIKSGAVVDDATLTITILTDAVSGVATMEIWGVENYTWTDAGSSPSPLRTNNGINFLNISNSGNAGALELNITYWVQNELDAGKNNFTILLIYSDEGDGDDYVIVATANAGTDTTEPKVVIQYTISAGADTTPPVLSYVDPTPPDGATGINNTYNATINITINNATNIDTMIFDWNGTNYTIFNRKEVLLFMQFENRTELGEDNTKVRDLSFYGNNGTYINNSFPNATGHFPNSKGLQLYQSTSSVNLTQTHITRSIQEFTILSWVKSDVEAGFGQDTIISFGNTQGNSYLSLFYERPSDGFKCKSRNGGTGDSTAESEVSMNGETNWNFVTCRYNGTDLITSVNGREDTNPATIPFINITGSSDMIGNQYALNQQWEGVIDYIMLINRSLSREELDIWYNASLQRYNESDWSFFINKSNTVETNNYTYQFHSNNTIGNKFDLPQRTMTIGTARETTPPYYTIGSNGTNSTTNNTDIYHFLQWNDGIGLDFYMVQFCNGTYSGGTCIGYNSLTIDNSEYTITQSDTRVNYDSISIINGGKLNIEGLVYLNATTITIDSTSWINGTGTGHLGGKTEGATGKGSCGGNVNLNDAGGGGGYGGAGSDAPDATAASDTCGSATTDAIINGSGGGAGSGTGWSAGGDGGGAVYITAENIIIHGNITMEGSNASDGATRAGGGGSGGGILLKGNNINISSATFSVRGGGGGVQGACNDCGGGGGGGRIKIFYNDTFDNTSYVSILSGGGSESGTYDGDNGTSFLTNTPSLSITKDTIDSWFNLTWTAFPNGGTQDWSNFTSFVTGNISAWCIRANDTSGNLNETSCNNPFYYHLTEEGAAPPVTDTCNCGGLGTDHVFDLSDECNVNNCTAANIYFSGSSTGFTTCSGNWNITQLNLNVSNMLFNMTSECYINQSG